MGRFEVTDTRLSGLRVVHRRRIGDERGFLARVFCSDELGDAGWRKPIAQINHTLTRKRGTVRGLHFQYPPHAEMKLVTCIRGVVWDVAVDLRVGSATFLQWHAEELSAENGCALLIPEGFAHGFQAVTASCELLYLHSASYAPDVEAGIHPQDERLAIAWPLPISEISPRDASLPTCSAGFEGIRL